jgi:hypothetical protein
VYYFQAFLCYNQAKNRSDAIYISRGRTYALQHPTCPYWRVARAALSPAPGTLLENCLIHLSVRYLRHQTVRVQSHPLSAGEIQLQHPFPCCGVVWQSFLPPCCGWVPRGISQGSSRFHSHILTRCCSRLVNKGWRVQICCASWGRAIVFTVLVAVSTFSLFTIVTTLHLFTKLCTQR